MAVLWWAAGEDIEFPIRTAGVISHTVSVVRRPTYVRASLLMPGVLTFGGVQAETPPLAAPVVNVYWTAQYWHVTAGAYGAFPGIGMGNSTAVVGGIFVGGGANPNADKLTLFSVDASNVKTLLTAEVGTTFANNARHRIDMHITGFNTESGNIKVFLEGNVTPSIDYTGDLTGLGFSDLDCLRCLSTGETTYVSEIIIANEETRAFVGVVSLAPDGAGDDNTFATGDETKIDEVTLDDADFLSSDTADQVFYCTLSDLPAGDYTVRGVKIVDRAVKGETGPTSQELGIKSGGTTDTENQALSAALANYERLMVVNPTTGLPWTVAQVNALQAAVLSAA